MKGGKTVDGKDQIQIKAKTIEEAIQIAEKKLGCKREELNIEVIQQPQKKLFGFREQKAIVSVSIKKSEEKSDGQKQEDEDSVMDGSAQIKGGKVIVTDPFQDGLAPTIAPGKNVQILVNGEPIEEMTEVSSQDEIIVLAEQVEPSWEARLRVSPDRLQAFLTIHRTRGQTYEIQDMPPQRELMVKAKLVEEKEPEIALDDLKSFLAENKIVYGIIEENLEELLKSKEVREVMVAQGNPGIPSKDAVVVNAYLQAEKAVSEEDDEEKELERVARHGVISVEPGQLIAEVVPPVPGSPGKDVLGQTIQHKPPKDIKLVAGNGVNVDEAGRRAFALIHGRPEVLGARVMVHPSYVISGDVDAKVGKIIFKGDVQVMGNVQDEMSIEATGQVVINGYAANATINAGSNVIVHRNIVGGRVRAGGLGGLIAQVMEVLKEIVDGLPQLLAAARQLRQHPNVAQNRDVARVGEGIILKILLGKKFAYLPEKLGKYRQDIANLAESLESEEFKLLAEEYEELYQKLSGNGPLSIKTLQIAETVFDGFRVRAETVMGFLQEQSTAKAELVTGYVQNSHIECSGDVRITGKGCYNSNIFAGGDVFIKGSPGAFRGGEITTNGNVFVRELGSPAEVATEIRIKPEKRVKAERVYPGVVICIGGKRERITYEQSGLVLGGNTASDS